MKKAWVSALGFILLMFTAVAGTAPVPDTGQTRCYNNTIEITCPSPGQTFYGQDANYTVNLISSTKLDGSGNVLPDSATSWVMVRDNVTGLIWEVKKNLDGVSNYSDPHDADNSYSWYDPTDSNPGTSGIGTDTKDFIDALNIAYFGGYSDWRMPTIKELAYIINYNVPMPGPTIDTNYFPNTKAAVYWSSTAYVSSAYFAWGVNFYYSDDYYGGKSNSYYTRAVRGGLTGSFGDSEHLVIPTEGATVGDRYVDNNDGTVTNTTNGLMWQKSTPVDKKTWEQVYVYCGNLSLAGHTDWRLPTQKELRSIVDYSKVSPAINTVYFPDTFMDDIYWSSTTDTYTTSHAWGISFDYGNDIYGRKYYSGFISGYGSYYVRAVRGGQGPLDDWVLSVSPASRNVNKDAGATTFSVSNTGIGAMPWTAAVTSGGSWLSIASGASGTNAGTITCAFNANTDTSVRTGTIRVTAAGATGSPVDVTVIQTLTSPLVLVSNSIGSRNTIKISDMSGTLPASGSTISVNAWDENGNALTESGSAPLKLNSRGTTTISGPDLAARFLNGTPMLYKFSIDSPKVVVTNVKNSTNDTFKVPIVYLNGVTDFVSNSIGNYNTIKVSDMSGTLPASGSTISVKGWDVNGNALTESGSAASLVLLSHGTTSISGSNLAARFPTGTPTTYEFNVQSAKVLVANIKSSNDGLIEIPCIFTRGISNFATNYVSSLNTIKISDTSGAIPADGIAISITAWDSNGNVVLESGSAAPLKLYNLGTITIEGTDIQSRFPSGLPALYEFSIGSSSAIVTSLTTSLDGTIETPTVFTIGAFGGI